jgi:hypothetical protein
MTEREWIKLAVHTAGQKWPGITPHQENRIADAIPGILEENRGAKAGEIIDKIGVHVEAVMAAPTADG